MAKFQKGQSGNPGGRPKDIANARKALQLKIAGKGDELVESALTLAKNGNEAMIKFLLDRLLPKQIEGFNKFNSKDDAKTLINNALDQYTSGEISSEALSDTTKAIQVRINAVELYDMKSKIDALWDAKLRREGAVPCAIDTPQSKS